MNRNILKKYPNADLKVYTVWMHVLRKDVRSAVPEAVALLDDPRVTQFWDPTEITGRWFKKYVVPEFQSDIAWDIYFLYDTDAVWDFVPSPAFGTGSTVLKSSAGLLFEFESLVEDSNE